MDIHLGSSRLQGSLDNYPLSPLLFILVVEGLSRLTVEANILGFIRGINIIGTINITYLLSMDDILLCGRGSLKELNYYKIIMDTYCKETMMEVDMRKSCLLFDGVSEVLKILVIYLFPMNFGVLDEGVKYPSFHLKSNDYKFANWLWL